MSEKIFTFVHCREVYSNANLLKYRKEDCGLLSPMFYRTTMEKKIKFCSEVCERYSCLRLRKLDKRYRTKYRMSMLDNLENIKILGIKKFVETEKIRWKCPDCGELLSVHKPNC